MTNEIALPAAANFVQQGCGRPVVLIHGIAASLHDWDDIIPQLTKNGYACYALDLLGHGDSPKPDSRIYKIEWLFDHFLHWITSLRLTEPAVLIGHSLGGYIALEYARRFSAWTRGLVLVSPFYSRLQLPPFLRRSYSNRNLRGIIAERTPQWMFRAVIDITSRAMGHSVGALHALPPHVRAQTALDYTRTAPGVYSIPSLITDLTEHLPSISLPTLVVWGDRDQTLAPSSFPKLVHAMPRAQGVPLHAGHVPHQSNTEEFNAILLNFLRRIEHNSNHEN
jgi:pimeloyl-ACP methyl ester carboxylesterase